MKYIKSYQIFEKVSSEEINDLFIKLTDDGFSINIKANDVIEVPHGPHSVVDFTHPFYVDDMLNKNSKNFIGITIYKELSNEYIKFDINSELVDNIEFAINHINKTMKLNGIIAITDNNRFGFAYQVNNYIVYDIKDILNITNVYSILLIFEY